MTSLRGVTISLPPTTYPALNSIAKATGTTLLLPAELSAGRREMMQCSIVVYRRARWEA